MKRNRHVKREMKGAKHIFHGFGGDRKIRMSHIQGVILDVDGTLVDSNDAHTKAWVEAMAQYGYTVAFDKVRPLIGMGGDKVLPETVGLEKNSEDGKRISQWRKEIFNERYLPNLHAFPGARELLERMRKSGLKLAIASSAEKDELSNAVLMIGDTAYDIEAAKKVNVDTIAFRCGGWNDSDLAGAIAIYDGPADLLEHYDDSPLAS